MGQLKNSHKMVENKELFSVFPHLVKYQSTKFFLFGLLLCTIKELLLKRASSLIGSKVIEEGRSLCIRSGAQLTLVLQTAINQQLLV